MKLNSKFFSGLSVGLLVGFITFGASTYFSSADDKVEDFSSISATQGWITVSAANKLAESYKSDFINANGLSENSTIGGTISKSDLKQIASRSSDDNIKFRFYHTDGNTGILFFPKRDGEQAFQSGSWCPPMCD